MPRSALLLLALAAASSPGAAAAEPLFPYPMKAETLPNGLRVVLVPTPSAGTVAYFTLVRVGSRHEVEAGKTGFAHFFEHMMFRGTDRFPEEAQRKLVSDLGLDSNAFTWDDETVYYYAGPRAALPSVIELEADRFQHLKYTREQFRTEAKSVLGEYKKNDSDPGQRVEEVLLDHAFTKHTYKHTTIGLPADILKMPEAYEYSLEFFRRYYRPDNCTIFVVGDLGGEADQAKLRESIRAAYGAWSGKAVEPRIAVEPAQSAERRASIEWPTDTRPRLTMGWHSPAAGTKEAAIARVVGPLLFGPSSRLYEDLVLTRQIVESFDVAYMGEDVRPGHRDPRLFCYTAMLKRPADLAAVEQAVEEAVASLRAGKVDAERLAAVKSHLRLAMLSSLETPLSIGEVLALYVAPTGRLDAIDSELTSLLSITPADVAAYANRYLTKNNRTVVVTRARAVAAKEGSPKEGAR